ncbi:hypothetical protein [Paraburkholderia sp. RL17-347-BIC-D]
MMFFFAIPPIAALVEAVVTAAVGAVVVLATKDAYENMVQSDNDPQ